MRLKSLIFKGTRCPSIAHLVVLASSVKSHIGLIPRLFKNTGALHGYFLPENESFCKEKYTRAVHHWTVTGQSTDYIPKTSTRRGVDVLDEGASKVATDKGLK